MQALNGFTITNAVQTGAAVNHGNSGGALLDAAGDLVGIPSQIADSGVDASVDGRVAHPWPEVSTAAVDAGLAAAGGLGADSGGLVTAVTDATDLQEAVDTHAPGDEVALTVVAPDGAARQVSVTLGTRPATADDATAATCG